MNGEQAAKYIEMGFDMVNIMNDVGALQGHVALAAKNALELGLKTGTPVYVYRNNKIVDLTKQQRSTKKRSKRD